MISFSLICKNNHEFEGWFRTSEDYELQLKKNLISCPNCNNTVIQKAIDKSKTLNIKGKELTPFLLKTIVKETGGKSLKTNVALAINNIELGTKIAQQISTRDKIITIK